MTHVPSLFHKHIFNFLWTVNMPICYFYQHIVTPTRHRGMKGKSNTRVPQHAGKLEHDLPYHFSLLPLYIHRFIYPSLSLNLYLLFFCISYTKPGYQLASQPSTRQLPSSLDTGGRNAATPHHQYQPHKQPERKISHCNTRNGRRDSSLLGRRPHQLNQYSSNETLKDWQGRVMGWGRRTKTTTSSR